MPESDNLNVVPYTPVGVTQINSMIKLLPNAGKISDGYHTYNELYAHRTENYMALCRSIAHWYRGAGEPAPANRIWRSTNHSDGKPAFGGGWFVLGIDKEAGRQITYHLPLSYWDKCLFAETLNKAPDFDGHTSEDVLYRLSRLFNA
jgi:hypothetical protein